MNLQIEEPANLERKLQERAQQAGVAVENFVLQTVVEQLAEPQPVPPIAGSTGS